MTSSSPVDSPMAPPQVQSPMGPPSQSPAPSPSPHSPYTLSQGALQQPQHPQQPAQNQHNGQQNTSINNGNTGGGGGSGTGGVGVVTSVAGHSTAVIHGPQQTVHMQLTGSPHAPISSSANLAPATGQAGPAFVHHLQHGTFAHQQVPPTTTQHGGLTHGQPPPHSVGSSLPGGVGAGVSPLSQNLQLPSTTQPTVQTLINGPPGSQTPPHHISTHHQNLGKRNLSAKC